MTRPTPDKTIRALHQVYASDSPEQASAIYDGWSEEYEEHMRGVGYTHPAMVASMLTRYQPPGSAPVLDAGTGTGIMGEILTALGYSNILGFDASEGMLSRAAAKDIYQDLRPGRLGERLDYDDDCFAATVASGVFTQGHAPLDGLDELVRVTRPDGHIVFSISRTYLGDNFETKARALERAGKWRRVDTSRRYNSTPFADEALISQAFAFAAM
ncbi:MAG: class I SAM-dependent methyltransferase [Gammaproteobacteria bacterium]|nr:class I SAM-dependent methyltransferase [Gammaproteobacteria bacterium]MDH3467899.1 class I SAM-dependent methyltransferase [Gammaproteobacteria bacterium]